MHVKQIYGSCFLTEEQKPSHNTFKNFVNNRLTNTIQDIFLIINNYLIKRANINTSELYIGGTKVEANANKYTFVWKKVAIKTRNKRLIDTVLVFSELRSEFDIDISYESITPELIDEVISDIICILNTNNIELVYGKGKRKNSLQRQLDKLVQYLFQLYSCSEKIDICGDYRGSYSKSDHDAR